MKNKKPYLKNSKWPWPNLMAPLYQINDTSFESYNFYLKHFLDLLYILRYFGAKIQMGHILYIPTMSLFNHDWS